MVSLNQICDYLNDLLERDSEAMNALLTQHTACNEALADSPDTPVWPGPEVTPLGVLCGLGGYDADKQRTKIVAWWNGKAITHFFVADSTTPELIERPVGQQESA